MRHASSATLKSPPGLPTHETMDLDPDTAQQEQILAELRRREGGLAAREAVIERLLGGGFLVLSVVLGAMGNLAGTSLLALVGATVAFAIAARVEFDISGAFAVPTQLAFVPLVCVTPPHCLPLMVGVAWTLARIPDLVMGRSTVSRLWVAQANGCFSFGPALVLIVAGVDDGAHAGLPVLLLALVAQFVIDLVASEIREAALRGPNLMQQIRESRVVIGIDAGLTPIGVIVGLYAADHAWAPVGLIPLLLVLAIFARERRERVRSLAELSNAYRGTAYVLGDVVEADDGYTGEHCRGVVQLVMQVGQRLDLSAERLRNLEFGALLHDVGKIAIPKEIINKPGKLDPGEWQVIKTHTTEGQALLDRVGGFMSEVGRIVRSHHERWDGGGYPDGLAGEDIPLEARIIAVCDTWNAMTTTRSYREALPLDAAVAELVASSGTQLDPLIVDAVLEILAACGVPVPAPAAAVAAYGAPVDQPRARSSGGDDRPAACDRF